MYIISNQVTLWPYPVITAEKALEKLAKYKGKRIGADCETEGFDPYTKELLLFQLGNETEQFIIDCTTVDIRKFKEFLEETELVFHNASFDLRFLYKKSIYPKKVFDTYLAEAIIYLGDKTHRKGLAQCLYRHLGVRLNKEIRGLIHRKGINHIDVLNYSRDDVKYSEKLADIQIALARERGVISAIHLDNKFVLCKAYLEHCGIYVNREKWLKKVEATEILFNKTVEELNNWVMNNLPDSKFIDNQLDLFSSELKCRINWASSHQIIELMDYLGVDTFVEKLGKKTVDQKFLVKLKEESPIIPKYLNYKKLEKELSTYGREFLTAINPVTGRIHSQFNQVISTGRMSSGQGAEFADYAKESKSTNLQNIDSSSKTRNCFEGQGDNTLVIADYSSQEGVVLCNLSLDRNMIEFYKSGVADQHSWVATKMFEECQNLEVSEVKKKFPELRQIAKIGGFSIAYGGNELTIAQNLNIPIAKAKEVYDAYFKAFPDLPAFYKRQHQLATSRGYIPLSNVSGRKHFIYNFEQFKRLRSKLNSAYWTQYREEKQKDSVLFNNQLLPEVREYFKIKGQIERNSQNYIVQGTAAETTKYAGVILFNKLRERDLLGKVLVVNIIHDEYVVECSEELAPEIAEVLEYCMEKGGEPFCKTIPLKADAEISKYWPGKD